MLKEGEIEEPYKVISIGQKSSHEKGFFAMSRYEKEYLLIVNNQDFKII